MDLGEIIERLEVKKNRLFTFLPQKLRPFFKEVDASLSHRAALIYGSRGVGKTTFLLWKAKSEGLFYVSGDDPLISHVPIYDLAEKVFLDGYSGIVVDEVHFVKDWGIQVKALYDSFPDRKILLSDSSSILLRKGVADLSRRFISVKVPLMSFREYIYFETGQELPRVEWPFGDLTDYASNILKSIDVLKLFREYRSGGTRPFYLEGNFADKVKNVVEKSIYYDVPFFIGAVSEVHLRVMRTIISFLAYSKVPRINVEAMCRDWGIGKAKLYQLLSTMEELDLIAVIFKEGKVKPHSKGDKLFFADPALYYVFGGEVGNFREAFVIFGLRRLGEVYSSRDEEEADLVFKGVKLEIGGRGKRTKGSDFTIRDDIDIPVRNAIPLWIFGMLW